MALSVKKLQKAKEWLEDAELIEQMLDARAKRLNLPLGTFVRGINLFGRARDPEICKILDRNDLDDEGDSLEFDFGNVGVDTDAVGLESPIVDEIEYSRLYVDGCSEVLASEVRGRKKTIETWERDDTHERRTKHIKERPKVVQRLELILRSAAMQQYCGLPRPERVARAKLKTMLDPAQWAAYDLEGAFFEKGRSGVIYLVRRGRPMIALREKIVGEERYVRFLAALCLHSHSYNGNSFVGSLPPSDDVIAHLLLIRSDEHELWKRSNQKQINDPTSGI